MATRKKQARAEAESGNYEKIKEEVISLLTGQEPGSTEEIDYFTVVKRATIILITVYGILRVSLVRKIALSIASAMVTKWIAEKVADIPIESSPAVA